MSLTTADRMEIQDLMGRFALAVDVNGPEAMRDLFVEGGRFIVDDLQINLQGIDNIINWIKDSADTFPSGLTHIQSNFVIDGDGDEAQLSCVSQAILSHDGDIKHFVVGRYFETLVKTPAGWRLKEHKLQLRA
ncbi:nuclear transport factor 2 family protein [Vibrio mediterranei]|uniref:Nuclear transport factor 2 family protein n=1 Tax=Vibrio barjaei TaxID=1676683 RepID=A0ABW7IIN5_9VIBR